MSETHVALCSGGRDSAVATHVSVRWGPADVIVYLDTGTGAVENREYVEQLADRLGVQCWTLRTHERYEDVVREHGFPGPSRHGILYRKLKERQIQKLAAFTDGDLHCWTGVRALESDRRMRTVAPEGEHDAGRWYWHAPLHDWTQAERDEYLERFDLPENSLWDTLGRSADCWCGCFGTPEELIDAEAAGCDDLVRSLRSLEDEVDRDDEKDRWAWGGLSDVEQRVERLDGDQVTLCSTCSLPDVATDGGEP